MDTIRKLDINTKGILKESIFGAFYTLWTAPIDQPKLTLPKTNVAKQNSLFFGNLNNLIIGHRP